MILCATLKKLEGVDFMRYKNTDAVAIKEERDLVEVVRCRYCKHFVDDDEMDMLGFCTCERIAIAHNGELYPERDFYCAFGERIEK
jgi:hypothetical protein